MTDTPYLDTVEKVDILLKSAYGFPSTDEEHEWYEETAVKFNNSINGEDVFLDVIPDIPDFDNNGIVRTANEIGLVETNFMNYNAVGIKSSCSIVDDSTGVVRRFKLLILEVTPSTSQPGTSWYKLNSQNPQVNVLQDSFQFNFKQYKDDFNNVNQPYSYRVNTQKSLTTPLPFGYRGGNYFIDLKSGILFFSDFGNLSTSDNSNFRVNNVDNKPVLTIYTYIGRKGIAKQLPIVQDINNISNPKNNQIAIQKTNNTIYRFDSSTDWMPIGGSGGGSGAPISELNYVVRYRNHETSVNINALNLETYFKKYREHIRTKRTWFDKHNFNIKNENGKDDYIITIFGKIKELLKLNYYFDLTNVNSIVKLQTEISDTFVFKSINNSMQYKFIKELDIASDVNKQYLFLQSLLLVFNLKNDNNFKFNFIEEFDDVSDDNTKLKHIAERDPEIRKLYYSNLFADIYN